MRVEDPSVWFMIARTFGIMRESVLVTSCETTREDTWLIEMRAARVMSQICPLGVDNPYLGQ